MRDVNDKNEIKSASFLCGFRSISRYPCVSLSPMDQCAGNSRLTLLIEISPVRHAGTERPCYRWFHAPSISTRHDHLGHTFSDILPFPFREITSTYRIREGITTATILRRVDRRLHSPSLLPSSKKERVGHCPDVETCSDSAGKK